MSIHGNYGGTPLKRHTKKKFPGRGRKGSGTGMNPEAFARKTAAAVKARTRKQHIQRPLVGR